MGLTWEISPKDWCLFISMKIILQQLLKNILVEALDYAAANKKVRIHFTVSKDHREKFEDEVREVVPKLEDETNHKFEITYSYQDPKTDTVAVTMENEPFRDEKEEIFFRPGGHGALIKNLNDRDADHYFY